MIGRRIPDGEWMTRQADNKIRPGDYGKDRWPGSPEEWVLFFCPPSAKIVVGHWLHMEHADHDVRWHEDGTVTVNPSILVGGPQRYNGWLRRGVWIAAA